MRWIRRVAIVLGALAVVGGIVGLVTQEGGSTDPSRSIDESPAGAYLVTSAATVTSTVGSLRETTTIEYLRTDIVPDGATIRMSGRWNVQRYREQTELFYDLKAIGLGQMQIIVDDDDVYMRGDVIRPITRSTMHWLHINENDERPAAQVLLELIPYLDAPGTLGLLQGADGVPRPLGSDEVANVPTEAYEVDLRLDLAYERISLIHRVGLENDLELMEEVGMDPPTSARVWIDDDGYVRKVILEIRMGRRAGGGRLRYTSVYTELGRRIRVMPPPEEQVVELA
jgi:hypothetical protein